MFAIAGGIILAVLALLLWPLTLSLAVGAAVGFATLVVGLLLAGESSQHVWIILVAAVLAGGVTSWRAFTRLALS